MKTVYIFDNPLVDNHIPISRLPETPERTRSIRQALSTIKDSHLVWITPEPLPFDRLLNLAKMAHNEDYLTYLSDLLDEVEQTTLMIRINGDDDCFIDEGTRGAICASIACVVDAVAVVSQSIGSRAFINVRPPGHHCTPVKAMGFCMLNNLAIGVRLAQLVIKRVAIVDWDYHHGNGTQDIFYSDPNVLYISLHGDYTKSYPGTGDGNITGNYDNVLNINLPLASGHESVVSIFQNQVMPKIAKFVPGIIFISCGFDAHELDPIGCLKYTADTYAFMTQALVNYADQNCNGRVISMLEGGYNVQALKESSVAHVKAML